MAEPVAAPTPVLYDVPAIPPGSTTPSARPSQHDRDRRCTSAGNGPTPEARPIRPSIARRVHPVLAGMLGALLIVAAGCGSGGTPEARTGQAAPPFTATALDGTGVDLDSLRGRPVVVNFWASWCMPCREEFPLLADKLAELGPTDGLALIGVLYKDEPELAQRFLDEFGAPWPTVDDPDGSIAAAYRVVAPPQTYFIDAEGILRGIQISEVREADFDTQYAKIRP